MSSGKKTKPSTKSSVRAVPEKASECEIFKWYKVCVWAIFTGTGWFCSMPVCWREMNK